MATAQFYLSQQPAQPQQQPLINNIEHKPILAERFKTKPCQNFDRTGFCPYEARCMFAHGEHDLRTADMNVADKLVTEDAIKAWQRAKMIADRLAARKRAKKAAKKEAERANRAALAASTTSSGSVAKPAVVASSAGDSSEDQPQRATPDTIPSAKSPRVETSAVIVNLLTKLGNTAAPTAAAPAQVAPATTPARRYRHNPYAAVPLVPAVCEVPRASMDLPAARYAATTAAAQQYLGHQPYVTMDVPTTTAYATSMSSSSVCYCAHCLSATQQRVLPMPPMRCAPSLASVAPHGGVNTILLA